MKRPAVIATSFAAIAIVGALAWCLSSGVIRLGKLTGTKRPPHVPNVYDLTLHGKVVDEKGNPVEGARLMILRKDESHQPSSLLERDTGAAGTFSAEITDVGSLTIRAIKPDYESPSLPYGPFGGGYHLDFQSQPALLSAYATSATPLTIPLFKSPLRKTGTLVLPPDHKPTAVPFGGATPFPEHRIEIHYSSDRLQRPENLRKKFAWRIEIRAPHGGVIAKEPQTPWNKDAPATGYVPSVTFDFPESLDDKEWDSKFKRIVLVRFNDGTHGYLSFLLMAWRDRFQWETGHNPIPGDTYIGGKTTSNW